MKDIAILMINILKYLIDNDVSIYKILDERTILIDSVLEDDILRGILNRTQDKVGISISIDGNNVMLLLEDL